MKFAGFVGPSYTAYSPNVADEECINLFAETIESPGAQTQRSYYGTPGLASFIEFDGGPSRGGINTGSRVFEVAADTLYEIFSDGTKTSRGTVSNDGNAVSMAFSNIQFMIVGAGSAYCYTLATDTLVDVTADLAGLPIKVKYSDGYFTVIFQNSNKFQISAPLDGTSWPGIQVNAVSVFAENIVSIEISHRELWVLGQFHAQPYQNTGSDNIYDVIPGALIETGALATFGTGNLDNTVFWVSEDERGARQVWRANGYSPARVSTHAVEYDLTTMGDISGMVAYSYQDMGHLFWVIYIPGSQWSWTFDVAEGLWHKRATWIPETATWEPHPSWNHISAFGKHLVGDWQTGNLYEIKMAYDTGGGIYAFVTDNGATIRRVRRSPTTMKELERIYFSELKVQFATGLGPQPPLTDGNGDPRQPEAILRWSDDSGNTWSNEQVRGCGFAGQYSTFVRWNRLGETRYGRVFELTLSDPVPWIITDAFMKAA